ncbi:MAG: hypothetical protein ILA03_01560 [Bacteroidaceae bacterium]|nr:hypothetical protein [Bacteroidaceae bacterium]
MKLKHLFFLLFLALISCNNEPKAYEAAVKSNSIGEVNRYLNKYPDAPQDHLVNISTKLANLISDSLDYSNYLLESDLISRHDLGIKYKEKHPDGVYFDKVVQSLEEEESSYQKALKINEIRNYMGYRFSQSYYPYLRVQFSLPDEDGKGVIAFDNYYSAWWRYQLCFYEINDNYDVKVMISKGDEKHPINWFFSEDGKNFTCRVTDDMHSFLEKWLGFPVLMRNDLVFDGNIILEKGDYKINQASFIEEEFERAYGGYGVYDDQYAVMDYLFKEWKKVGIQANLYRKLSELLDKAAESNSVDKYNYIKKLLESIDY